MSASVKKAISRYKLPWPFDGQVPVASDAEALSVGFQFGELYLWAMHTEGAPERPCRFLVLAEQPIKLPPHLDILLIGRADRFFTIKSEPAIEVFHVFQVVSSIIKPGT